MIFPVGLRRNAQYLKPGRLDQEHDVRYAAPELIA